MKSPQAEWNHRNLDNMRENAVRYRENHPEKVKEQNDKRDRRYQRYGITTEQVKAALVRQFYRCLGCMKPITLSTANVDHDHATNTFRGLLCRTCNWALGMVHEEKDTLYRLAAYLFRDPKKTNVYIIGSLKNEEVPKTAIFLREQGYEVFDEWYSTGPEADDYWQKYEIQRGRPYQEALSGRGPQNIFLFDKANLAMCDAAVLVMPGGKSSHLELGYIRGLGKPGFILLHEEQQGRYEVMPNFATAVCKNKEELNEALRNQFSNDKLSLYRL
jgi:recombination endonuclease VII